MSAQPWRQGIVTIILVSAACRGGAGATDKTTDSAAGAATGTAIEGAWRLAEFKPENGPAIGDPASLYIFTADHYSMAYALADSRPAFAKQDTPTDAEKAGAYDSFITNAGTYDIADDTLVIHPIISKHPGYMGGGEDKFLMRSSGDTLWLTSVRGAFLWANKQAATPSTESFTLVRAR
jgi:hypothetical protein